jgi:hypothetical protein
MKKCFHDVYIYFFGGGFFMSVLFKRITSICLVIAVIGLSVDFSFSAWFRSSQDREPIYVENGKYYGSNGKELILRGVNTIDVYYLRPGGDEHLNALERVKEKGINAIRLTWNITDDPYYPELDRGAKVKELERMLNKARELDLYVIITLHYDSYIKKYYNGDVETGMNMKTMEDHVAYWVKDAKYLLDKNRDILIVNILNEFGTHHTDDQLWVKAHQYAIRTIRDFGITNSLMIDPPNWGTNVDKVFTIGKEVLQEDSLKNTSFGLRGYLWDGTSYYLGTKEKLVQTITKLNYHKIPFLFAEFAHKNLDHDPIMDVPMFLNVNNEMGVGYFSYVLYKNEELSERKHHPMSSNYASNLDEMDWSNLKANTGKTYFDFIKEGEKGRRLGATPSGTEDEKVRLDVGEEAKASIGNAIEPETSKGDVETQKDTNPQKETQSGYQNDGDHNEAEDEKKGGFFDRILSIIKSIYKSLTGSAQDENKKVIGFDDNSEKIELIPKLSVEEEGKGNQLIEDLQKGKLQESKESEQFLRDMMYRNQKDLNNQEKEEYIQSLKNSPNMQTRVADEIKAPSKMEGRERTVNNMNEQPVGGENENSEDQDNVSSMREPRNRYLERESTSWLDWLSNQTIRETSTNREEDSIHAGTNDMESAKIPISIQKEQLHEIKLEDYPTLLVTFYDKGPQVQMKPGRYIWEKYIEGRNIGDTILYSYEPFDPLTGDFEDEILAENLPESHSFIRAYIGKNYAIQYVHSRPELNVTIRGEVYNQNFAYPLGFDISIPNSGYTFDVLKEIDEQSKIIASSNGDRYASNSTDHRIRVKRYKMVLEIRPEER